MENNIDFQYTINNPDNINCIFELNASGTVWGNIQGTLSNQTDLQNTLDLMNEQIEANHEEIGEIGQTIGTYGDIVTYNAAYFATANQGIKADTALQPNDNISELANDVGYITSASLPTVNNATLTIQKNSTTIDTFTANASVDKTINITVPVNASDINALPNSTKYGASIDMSLNTTDYKLTISLKDQDGTTLNSKIVDFPIESVVVNGSYDSTNEKIILTLQNGNTIDIPVGDLISGLQTEITSSNKLDADLVDDSSSTNKFVTANDLSLIGTALQPNDNITQLTNNAGYITNSVNNLVNYTLSSSLSTVATSGSYNDLLNKPTIPTVNNNTITITQGGVTKGSFTLNQNSNATIALDAGGGTVDQTYDGTSTNAQSGVAIEGELANYQTTSNLVTSISSSSTDAQYPSAKCVYDIVGDIESILHNINSGS